MTIAINPQGPVSAKPVQFAVPPGAERHGESNGGRFQQHLDQSLQEDGECASCPTGGTARATDRPSREKSGKKRTTADDALPVQLQEAGLAPEPLLIHLPGGAIVTPQVSPKKDPDSPLEEGQADLPADGKVAALQLQTLPEVSAGEFESKATGGAFATPKADAGVFPVAEPEVRKPESGRETTLARRDPAEPAGSAAPNELAFAARIRPVTATAESSSAAPRSFRPTPQFEGNARAATEEKARGPEAPSPTTAATPSRATSFDLPSTPEPALLAATRAGDVQETRRVDSVQDQPKTVTPLKDLSLNLGQTPEQKVEVRVTERSGELHVAVRTADNDLAHGLRQGLPEVVGRLSENGFHTETWHPAGGAAVVSAAAEAGSSSSDFQQQDPQNRGGAPQDQQGQRGQQHADRPKWLEELEGSIPNRESRGESYGIRN